MYQGFKDLIIYQKAYSLAMDIYNLSKNFPKEETYSLTDQIRRPSRSVCATLAEGYRKRIYPKHFVSKLSDCDAECSETIIWLDFARDCKYILPQKRDELVAGYEEVGKMLGTMMKAPEKFKPR